MYTPFHLLYQSLEDKRYFIQMFRPWSTFLEVVQVKLKYERLHCFLVPILPLSMHTYHGVQSRIYLKVSSSSCCTVVVQDIVLLPELMYKHNISIGTLGFFFTSLLHRFVRFFQQFKKIDFVHSKKYLLFSTYFVNFLIE